MEALVGAFVLIGIMLVAFIMALDSLDLI